VVEDSDWCQIRYDTIRYKSLTLWHPLLPYEYRYKASYAQTGLSRHLHSDNHGSALSVSARMSKNYKWWLNAVWKIRLLYCCTHMATVHGRQRVTLDRIQHVLNTVPNLLQHIYLFFQGLPLTVLWPLTYNSQVWHEQSSNAAYTLHKYENKRPRKRHICDSHMINTATWVRLWLYVTSRNVIPPWFLGILRTWFYE